jgi:DMSO/TMAO reductase YedYZ molybdopterin-dependent catalytic subunit
MSKRRRTTSDESRTRQPTEGQPKARQTETRRRFLRVGGLAAISAILPTWGCDRNDVTFRDTPTGPDMDMADMPVDELPAAPITPNDRFYLQSINGVGYDPRLQVDNWSMQVDGLVDNPIASLTFAQLTSMPMQRQVMTMQCIGNWIGGPLIGNAEWGGTPLANLLQQVGVQERAIRLKFTSVDGYTTSIPLERALRDDVLLAWEMNGDALPSKHGFEVRLINPGHYGQKMPKWITRIELIDEVHLGFWESKPEGRDVKWSDDAFATVNSRVDAPISVWDDEKDPGNGGVTYSFQRLRGAVGDEYQIHGIALAGERSVDLVEVSTDGGMTWHAATILTQSEPNVWVRWAYAWSLPASGRYEVLARATDSAGVRQPRTDSGADLYDGRTGWHSVPVDVSTT